LKQRFNKEHPIFQITFADLNLEVQINCINIGRAGMLKGK